MPAWAPAPLAGPSTDRQTARFGTHTVDARGTNLRQRLQKFIQQRE
jgi:hypothetical protein